MLESLKQNNRSKSVAFSGHRSFKLREDVGSFDHIRVELRNTLRLLYEQGYDTFYTGMSEGFDLVAAEEVIALRREYENIRLIAVIPFAAQSRSYDLQTTQTYIEVLGQSDERLILSSSYHAACFHGRNDYLIDNSSVLVCYYSGKPGGTRYTLDRAEKSGHRIINIDPEYVESQLSLAFPSHLALS